MSAAPKGRGQEAEEFKLGFKCSVVVTTWGICLGCSALVEYFPFSSIMSFLLGVHLYPKTCIKFLSHLGSSCGLYSSDPPPVMGGFSPIALISLPSVSCCPLLSVSLPCRY